MLLITQKMHKHAQYTTSTVLPTTILASIRSTLQCRLPQKKENYYDELYISVSAHMFPVNPSINCYYATKSTDY
jgi:hypothetical protein